MSQLWLFGQDRTVPHDGPIGGAANTLKLSVAPAGNKVRVSAEFSGEVPGAKIGLTQWTMDCDDTNGRLQPISNGIKLVKGGDITFAAGMHLSDTTLAGVAVTDRHGHSAAFLPAAKILDNLIRDLGARPAVAGLDPGSFSGVRLVLAPDFSSSTMAFVPTNKGGQASISHNYRRGPLSPLFTTTQPIDVAAIHVSTTGVSVRAPSPSVLIHGDLLDKRPPDEKNKLFYQQALVNGELEITANHGALDNQAVNWVPRAGSDLRPALLALRWRDENGHPLAFHADDDTFSVSERDGFDVVPSPDDATQNELSNRTIGVSTASPLRLVTLDPIALYGKGSDAKNPHYWATGSEVPVTTVGPAEIHGMSRGTVLRCPKAPGGLECKLKLNKLVDTAQKTLAWMPHIELKNTTEDWSLAIHLEERDSKVGDGKKHGPPSARVAAGKTGPLKLPLIDPTLSVVNLLSRDDDGNIVAATGFKSAIVKHARDNLSAIDAQFVGPNPGWLKSPPSFAKGPQAHRDGFALLSRAELPAEILSSLKVVATNESLIHATKFVASPSAIAAETTNTGYLHGIAAATPGDLDQKVTDIADKLKLSDHWNDALIRFGNQWIDPDNDIAAAIEELRALLDAIVKLPQTIDPEADIDDATLDDWLEFYNTALDVLDRGDLDDVEFYDPEAMSEFLRSLSLEDFIELCQITISDPARPEAALLAPLVRWLSAPPDPDLFRRAVRLLVQELFAGGQFPARLERLKTKLGAISYQDFIRRLFGTEFLQAGTPTKILEENLAGFLTDLGLAANQQLENIRTAWEKQANSAFDALKAKYGPVLTDDILAKIGEVESEVEALKSALASVNVLIDDIRTLLKRPPDYLFVTRRFASLGAEWDKALRLWSGRFNLCKLASGLPWNFFLGESSSLIVKLGDHRTLPEIIDEIQAQNKAAGGADPLGLARLDATGGDAATGAQILKSKLSVDLVQSSWKGLFLLHPTADISGDGTMRDLCGFDYIEAMYVAVAGRPLDNGLPDISAIIDAKASQEKLKALEKDPNASWHGDVDFGLVRFSVGIRRSVLDTADIAFQIRVKNLLGKQHPEDSSDQTTTRVITLRGTLPPPDPANPNAPRDLVFSAVLDRPYRVEIDLLCFDYIDFSAIKVGRRDNHTFLDIDADVKLKPTDSLGTLKDFLPSEQLMRLEGFKISLPGLDVGASRPIGKALGLDFDWPSVSFPIPKARSLTLFGLDIVPTGIGFLRGEGGGWDALKAKFGNIDNWGFPNLPAGKFTAPHFFVRIGFGSLPAIGVSGKLSFDLLVGIIVGSSPPTISTPFIAVQGFAAKNLKIDLFRLLTLEVKTLAFRQNWKFELQGNPSMEASGLLAEDATLKLLNWNPLGDGSKLSFASFHRRTGPANYQNEAVIITLDASSKPSKGGFLDIHWVIVSKNLQYPKRVYDYLLEKDFRASGAAAEAKGLLANVLNYPKQSTLPPPPPGGGGAANLPELAKGKLAATFTENQSWLFAISLSLGSLLELCTIVFHDQHYYGIKLRDNNWVPLVFGQDTIELAYIPGARRELDRFRTNLRIPLLDMLGPMASGEVALEWAVNWDFLIDIGFPWKTGSGNNWFRAFSLPLGTYEGKFGFYIEKRTEFVQEGGAETRMLVLGAGMAIYVGLYAGFGNSIAYVRAGIGVFGIMEGHIWLRNAQVENPLSLLKSSVYRIEVTGVIGIFAYAEGRIEIWIISASFRAWAQASLGTTVIYIPGSTCTITYTATLAAGYSASVRIGSGFFSYTFSVSGTVSMPIHGRLLLA